MSIHHWLKRLITSWVIVADTALVLVANVWDRARLGNKATLCIALWLTIDSYFRGWNYVDSHEPTMATASTIGAILLPTTSLLGYVYRQYNTNRPGPNDLPPQPCMPPDAPRAAPIPTLRDVVFDDDDKAIAEAAMQAGRPVHQ